MSRIKSPQEKKHASLELDRRNVYGENAKASRKGIRKGKQRSHMEERRAAKAPLFAVKGVLDEDVAVQAELDSRLSLIQAKRVGFKKRPDLPLKEILRRKSTTGRRFQAGHSFTNL
jgi:hypothetical protein